VRQMLMSELLAEFRFEARLSSDVAHGSQNDGRYRALLRRKQEELFLAFDWPQLAVVQSVAVPAGQRYTAYPSLIRHENVNEVFFKNASGDYDPLTYGIGITELNEVDSDADERREYVRRWQHYLSEDDSTVSGNMFELWPVPVNDTTIRFAAKRALRPLAADADRTTLDGPMIALAAAAEILAGQKAEDAPLKLQMAAQRYDLLRKRQASPNNAPINTSMPARGANPQRFRIPE